MKLLNTFLCLLTLMLAMDTRAAQDNLKLTQYKNASEVPAAFLTLGGGSSMTGKTYKDDEGKSRQDKIYYTVTHSYESSYRNDDILRLLNPSDGRLGNLFEETTVKASARAGLFDVLMKISTPLKDFDCASSLSFKKFKSGNKNIFVYSFTNFNMVFTDMVIQVEVEDSKVKLSQITAMKGTTYKKLKNFLAVGKFEKALKENIRRFKDGLGGV